MKNDKQKVIVILGPTSSGKSALAIKLAKKFNGEVISADSRQVFRYLNHGTGKIVGAWQTDPSIGKKLFVSEKIPHHLIDFVSPRLDYNVAQFKIDCEKSLSEISSRGKLPLICGGSGFWISAITDGLLFPEIKPNRSLRLKLEKATAEDLFKKLTEIDPRRAREIDPQNKQRLIRALEICAAIGKVPRARKLNHPRFNFLKIGLKSTKEELNKKIQTRLETRWLAGMIEEVRMLHQKKKLSWKKIQSFGLAYYWIPLYLQKEIGLKTLKEKVYLAEKNYAKRQRTWFKRDPDICWYSSEKKIFSEVTNFINN